MHIEVVVANIVEIEVEVVVTAANASLVGGGGVDAAVHKAAGPQLLQALRPLAPCPPGGAVITPSFRLPPPVRYVVHAVGPRYGIDEPAAELLASAYQAALARCDEVSATSVAFPCLSAGAYGYPLQEACEISARTLRGATTTLERCVLVAFDTQVYKCWQRAVDQLGGGPP